MRLPNHLVSNLLEVKLDLIKRHLGDNTDYTLTELVDLLDEITDHLGE